MLIETVEVNVAMMQPAFLPWQGYFGLISRSDVFVLLDDFQFSLQSYHQRNRLFVDKGLVDWYTVSVDMKKSFKKPLNETEINYKIPWQRKMLKRIQHNYIRAPYYEQYYPFIEDWLMMKHNTLAVMNTDFILQVCRWLGLEKKIVNSSEWPSAKQRSERVLELLRINKASKYLCAHGSFKYMLEDGVFPVTDIDVAFQKYKLLPYSQINSDNFIPSLSILDALFNVGANRTNELLSSGNQEWIAWMDMQNVVEIPE